MFPVEPRTEVRERPSRLPRLHYGHFFPENPKVLNYAILGSGRPHRETAPARLFCRIQNLRNPEVGQYEVPSEEAEDFGSLMQAGNLVCIIGVRFRILASMRDSNPACFV